MSCGATIITGSPTVLIDDGRPVARLGDSTDHGGALIEGDARWTVE
ncbi:PAAR domain-containing protein [Saezia sanguinis]